MPSYKKGVLMKEVKIATIFLVTFMILSEMSNFS